MSLTTYHVKPGHDAAMTATIGKITAALTAANYPLHSIWYRLVNGGAPAFAVVTPRANMATFSNVVMSVIEKQLGKAARRGAVERVLRPRHRRQTELLQRRADLSYAPELRMQIADCRLQIDEITRMLNLRHFVQSAIANLQSAIDLFAITPLVARAP